MASDTADSLTKMSQLEGRSPGGGRSTVVGRRREGGGLRRQKLTGHGREDSLQVWGGVPLVPSLP